MQSSNDALARQEWIWTGNRYTLWWPPSDMTLYENESVSRLRMKLKRVNNETTKNNKIMEQETANVRGDNDRPNTICAGNRNAVISRLVRAPHKRSILDLGLSPPQSSLAATGIQISVRPSETSSTAERLCGCQARYWLKSEWLSGRAQCLRTNFDLPLTQFLVKLRVKTPFLIVWWALAVVLSSCFKSISS